jgi:hypothetical protein
MRVESFACCRPAKALLILSLQERNRRSVLLADKVEHCLLLFMIAKIFVNRINHFSFLAALTACGLFF